MSAQPHRESVRVAFCIECHKYTPVLNALVDLLNGPQSDIYIHVDKKCDIAPFATLSAKAELIADRCEVYWGRFGNIDAMLRLFKASRSRPCDYIVILSGDTLPMRPQSEILAFFEEALTRKEEFLSNSSSLNVQEIRNKVFKTHYFDKTTTLRHIQHIVAKIFRPRNNQYTASLPALHQGANWIATTAPCRDWMLNYIEQHRDYIQAFHHSLCGDEICFHTLVSTSEFAANNTNRSVMFTDWSAGGSHPTLLSDGDFELIALQKEQHSHLLFARKFNDHTDVANYIDKLHL